jgi:hypothetical protein
VYDVPHCGPMLWAVNLSLLLSLVLRRPPAPLLSWTSSAQLSTLQWPWEHSHRVAQQLRQQQQVANWLPRMTSHSRARMG